ncbi:ATP-binding protein [Aquabacterium sp. A3]|uniref:ATP-binding protein n=1 Tax=Aquabacterium sp. A3 TaxID=3132829 RepID=UPI00311A75E6
MSAVNKADAERIALLRVTSLVQGGPHPACEALVRLAARHTGAPVAAINLVDEHSVTALAHVGEVHRQHGRQVSLCGWVVDHRCELVVVDMLDDDRLADRLGGLPAPTKTAYLGYPIMVEGQALGTVCVLDQGPRQWRDDDLASLRDVASAAAALIEGELKGQRARRMEARVRTASQAGSDWLWETDAEGKLQWVSASLVHHTGLDPAVEVGVIGAALYRPHPDHLDNWDRFQLARQRREPFVDMIGMRDTPRGPLVVSVSGIPVFDSAGTFKGYRGASRNVTRQIEAEQQARRLNELLRQAVEGFHLGVMVSDSEGRILISNQQWRQWAGSAYQADDPWWPATVQRMLAQGDWPDAGHDGSFMPWIMGLRHSNLAHEQRFRHGWVQLRDTLLPNGSTVHVVVDITDRRQALDKLQVSETLYRTVASTINDGLLITELSGRVVALNPAGCRILGVERGQLKHLDEGHGLCLLDESQAQALAPDQHPVLVACRRGVPVSERTLPLRRPDQQICWVNLSCHPLRTEPQSDPFAVLTRLRDVTHEREALMQLAQSEERWKFALEGAGDGVWDWDLDTGQVFLSTQWKAMLGYADNELPNAAPSFFEHVHPDDKARVASSLQAYVEHGQGEHQLEYRMLRRDGKVLHVLSRGKVMLRTAQGQPRRIVGTNSDVTLLREAARNLAEKQLAEASSAAKSAFLSRMSHEIRTPLNAIHGFAQLLRLQPDVQRGVIPSMREHVEQILLASQHLGGLINEVLDLQQVEAGRMQFHLEPVNLLASVERMVRLLEPLAHEHGVTLLVQATASQPVLADRQRLEQALMNLLSNAIKYNRPGGQVAISSQDGDGHTLHLSIQDTGRGMSPEQLSRLYQPFERLGRETSGIEGTGLGLIITRSLVEAMGGNLTISSQLNEGTRAILSLPKGSTHAPGNLLSVSPPPATGAEPASVLSAEHTPAPPALPSKTLQVLYVEDNRINAMLFEEALRPFEELQLTVAEDGDAAIEMAMAHSPGVLVLDAHLPGMSGFDVLRVLRTLPGLATVPAYMCSADAMPEDIERALAEGFTGYWTKPIDIVAVTTELRRLAASAHNDAP